MELRGKVQTGIICVSTFVNVQLNSVLWAIVGAESELHTENVARARGAN